MSLGLVFAVVLIALAFTYINGFHDTANSIATVVATKVLSPGQAVLLAAATNMVGAMWGTAVAATIAAGIVNTGVVHAGPELLICALLAAIVWNLITWWLGLPSSSSHALVGSLVGAAIAESGGRFTAVIWAQGGAHWWEGKGVLPKVVMPMVMSPLLGFVLGFALMGLLYALLAWFASRRGFLRYLGRTPFVNGLFGKLQILSASTMGLAHGMNDAQKSMGLIALALAGATTAHAADAPVATADAQFLSGTLLGTDLGNVVNACHGHVEKDATADAWIYLPKGTCERIVGGTLTAKK